MQLTKKSTFAFAYFPVSLSFYIWFGCDILKFQEVLSKKHSWDTDYLDSLLICFLDMHMWKLIESLTSKYIFLVGCFFLNHLIYEISRIRTAWLSVLENRAKRDRKRHGSLQFVYMCAHCFIVKTLYSTKGFYTVVGFSLYPMLEPFLLVCWYFLLKIVWTSSLFRVSKE